MVTNFVDVSPSLMYDVLHDADYRRCWDENMSECFEICQIDRYNDIGYYSSKSIGLCPDVLCSIVFTDQGDQVQVLLMLLCFSKFSAPTIAFLAF